MLRASQRHASCDEDAIAALKRRISHRKLAHSTDVHGPLKDGGGQATAMDVRYHANMWAISHGKMPFKAPLPKALDDRIRVWFSSINRDSGQCLTAKDVARALELGGMTSDKHSVMQLIRSIDLDDSGTIELHEFEVFIRELVARGHFIDESTILLPSGQMLVLGDMVSNCTRQNMLHDMIAGGERRERWARGAGEKALEVIASQRNLAHMVMCHRETLRRHASILLCPSDIAVASASTLRSDIANTRANTLTRQGTFARLAAAGNRAMPKVKNRHKLHRKKFRQMLLGCIEETRPAMDHMLQSLSGYREKLEFRNSEGPLEDILSSRFCCDAAQAWNYQDDSSAMFMASGQQQTDAISSCPGSLSTDCEVRHLKRLEEGLQESSQPDTGLAEMGMETPTIMLQTAVQPTPAPQFSLDRLPQACTANASMQQPQRGQYVKLQPQVPGKLEQSSSVRFEGDGRLNLAPLNASPRRATFAQAGRTASAVISALHDRVRPPNNTTSARNLTFQWNRQFIIKQGTETDSPWHDVSKTATGVPAKAKTRLLHDGGLAATPLLPTMCQQDLDNRRRLSPLPAEIAAKRTEYIRNRHRGLRPPYVCSTALHP